MRSLLILLALTASVHAQSSPPAPGASLADDTPQIQIEVRFLSGPPEMFANLKSVRHVRRAVHDDKLALPDLSDSSLDQSGGVQLVSARTTVEQRQPVAVRTLTDDAVRSLVRDSQASAEANILSAPKVVVFDGQAAEIKDTTLRPFVVGLAPDGSAAEPQVETVSEGTQMRIRARVRGEAVRLDVALRLAQIDDVRTSELVPGMAAIQIPSVASSEIQLSALVPQGETLAVCGFQTSTETTNAAPSVLQKVPYVSRLFKSRSAEHQELMILLTPRLVTPEDQK